MAQGSAPSVEAALQSSPVSPLGLCVFLSQKILGQLNAPHPTPFSISLEKKLETVGVETRCASLACRAVVP